MREAVIREMTISFLFNVDFPVDESLEPKWCRGLSLENP